MLERRWLVVVLALALTGLGAAITGLLFTSGINLLRDWRLDLLDEFPAWMVLPALGAIGGMVSAWLITNLHRRPAEPGSPTSWAFCATGLCRWACRWAW